MSDMYLDDTITAIATPIGEGGIGIVRLSGPSSIAIADKIFVSANGKKASSFKTYTMHYGHIVDKSTGSGKNGLGRRKPDTRYPIPDTQIIDEVILTVMRSPKSYTREDTVEINCHGGIQAAKQVLDMLIKAGARPAQPGEFTKRAFMNGRIDLSQAEAVLDVVRAKTQSSLKIAIDQLEGGLSDSVGRLRCDILEIAAQIEASIDFSEEDIEPDTKNKLSKKVDRVLEGLKKLIESYEEGLILREGILAIICGKPNVGKSSLMNLLLKRDRMIISPVPGTTRDAVEEMINLSGIPMRLVDTAGIIETKDYLEREGVARSRKYMGFADMAIVVFDSSGVLDDADLAVIEMVGRKRKVAVVNKTDLGLKIDMPRIRSLFSADGVVEISVKNKTNIDRLEKTIGDFIWRGRCPSREASVVSNARHKALLDKSLESMLSVKKAIKNGLSPELTAIDLKEAIDNMGLIVGKTVSQEILERIFEQFCVGK